MEATDFNDIETSGVRRVRIHNFYSKVDKSKNVTIYKAYLKQKDWEIEDIDARTKVLIKQLERRFPKSGKADLDSYKEISARLR